MDHLFSALSFMLQNNYSQELALGKIYWQGKANLEFYLTCCCIFTLYYKILLPTLKTSIESQTSLKQLERNLFHETIRDGSIDLQIGFMLLIFVLAPLLSSSLGDFWSSAVFLPIWIVFSIGLRAFKKTYIQPRIGQIEFSPHRKKRLKSVNLSILVFNLVALGLGLLLISTSRNLKDGFLFLYYFWWDSVWSDIWLRVPAFTYMEFLPLTLLSSVNTYIKTMVFPIMEFRLHLVF